MTSAKETKDARMFPSHSTKNKKGKKNHKNVWIFLALSTLFTVKTYTTIFFQTKTSEIFNQDKADTAIITSDIALPIALGKCVSFRSLSHNETLSLAEASPILKKRMTKVDSKGSNHDSKLVRVGLSFIEDYTSFWSMNVHKQFHFYHFLEFLLVAYDAMLNLCPADSSILDCNIKVAWIHVPHMTIPEIEGSFQLNRLLANLIFKQTTSLDAVFMHGMESNNDGLRQLSAWYTGGWPDYMTEERKAHIPNNNTRNNNYDKMVQQVDSVLFVHRHYCDHGQAGQMDAFLQDSFPAKSWHRDVWKGLGKSVESNVEKKNLQVCYIDRQKTSRRMPAEEHDWLVETLSNMDKVDFLHYLMEEYPAQEQILKSSGCDFLVGVHGNGLSHLLWMKPGSYVVEYFWGPPFGFCYGLLSRMMEHTHVVFWKGHQLEEERVTKHDRSFFDLQKNESLLINGDLARAPLLNLLKEALSKKHHQK